MVSLHIKVKPGSFKDEVLFDTEGNLVVKIREKPIDGAANEYLIKYLSKELKISKKNIVLDKGQASRFKKITFHLSESELSSILAHYIK